MRKSTLYFLIIFLLSSLLLFSFLGGTSVFQVAEARNAQCAREMFKSNDKVTPQLNGELRTDKPALEYFGMMLAYRFNGINEASARFFSAICGLLTILATFLFVRRNINSFAAFWSALILLASMHTIVQFRLATPDPYLILCHTLSLYLFLEGWKTKKWKWYAAMYAFIGLGILAKGPVGLLLPGLTALLFLLFSRTMNWKNILNMKPWWGTLITALFSLPWYIAVHLKTEGAWTKGFLFKHNLGRFGNAMDGHGGSFFITFLFVIVGMIPFSIFAIRAFRLSWMKRKNNNALLLSMISLVTIIIFYSLSHTRLFNYTTTAYPFFAIITAYYISEYLKNNTPKTKLYPELITLAIIGLAIPSGVWFWAKNTPPLTEFAWIAWFFIMLPVGTILALIWIRNKPERSLNTIAISFMLAGLVFFVGPFRIMDQQSPIQKRKELLQSYENIVAYRYFDNAFLFYSDKNIPVITEPEKLENYLRENENVLVLSRGKDFSYIDTIPGLEQICQDHDLFSIRSSVFYREK